MFFLILNKLVCTMIFVEKLLRITLRIFLNYLERNGFSIKLHLFIPSKFILYDIISIPNHLDMFLQNKN